VPRNPKVQSESDFMPARSSFIYETHKQSPFLKASLASKIVQFVERFNKRNKLF